MLKNLLDETNKALMNFGYDWTDVNYIILDDYTISIKEFKTLAADINYDSGYGLVCINETLKICGFNWWLSRKTYDGAERWIYNTIPKRPIHSFNHVTKADLCNCDAFDNFDAEYWEDVWE